MSLSVSPVFKLSNAVIHGDLFITEGVGNGDVWLETVRVDGRLLVTGSGQNSIHAHNLTVGDNVVVDKPAIAGSEPVRFTVIESNDLTIVFEGKAQEIILNKDIHVICSTDGERTVFNMFKADNSKAKPAVMISNNAAVDKITAYVPAEVKGSGSVGVVEAHTNGVVIDAGVNTNTIVPDTEVTVQVGSKEVTGNGVSAPTQKPSVTPDPSPETEPSPSNNGGGGGNNAEKTYYTVTFNTNGGSLVNSQIIASGYTAAEPITPTKTGFVFGGWYKEVSLTNRWSFNTDTVTRNITLYAKWTAVTLGGTATISGTNKIGETLSVNTSGITGGNGAFTYVWQADGVTVGTNSASYTISASDVGKAITCIITRADATGSVTGTLDFGKKVPYTILLNVSGNETGDTITAAPATGVVGAAITLNYTVSNTKTNNSLSFSGIATGITSVGSEGSGTRSYTVAPADAVNGVITITAAFNHFDKTLTGISIKSQPTKLSYTHGDTLDLSGIKVTLTYNDNSTEDVVFADFGTKGIIVNPASGAEVSHTTHNGQPITVSYGGKSANTNNLMVSRAVPTIIFPEASAITYGTTLSTSSLTGGSTTLGSFAWETGTTIPTVTNNGYNIVFTPSDMTNYDYSSIQGWDGSTGKIVRTVPITVNAKTVTVSFSADSKTYDGNTNATVTPSAAFVGGDNPTVNYTAVFESKTAGNGKTVNVTGISLSGTSAGNYTVNTTATATANINKLQLTIGTPSDTPTKTYDGSTSYTGDGITIGSLTNKIAADTVDASISSQTYNSANVLEANTITIVYAISGADAENYIAPANDTISATITKAAGAAVSGAPTVSGVPSANSITVNAVTNSGGTGQSVEYAISTANDGNSLSPWQNGTTFNDLTGGTSYYVYARTTSNGNYNAGTYQVSAAIKTETPIVSLSIGAPSALTYSNNTGSRNALTPIYSASPAYTERTATFTVEVSGFTNPSDASSVGLTITAVPGLTFSGHDATGNATSGTKTFTVTVTLADDTAFESGMANINITGLTSIPTGYTCSSTQSTTVNIKDGQAAYSGIGVDRRIPVNDTNVTAFNTYARTTNGLKRHYKQTENIILTGITWTAIGDNASSFNGSYDGDNHTISNLYFTATGANQGLFGYNGGTVKNLGMVDCTVNANYTDIGGIVGRNCNSNGSIGGIVENCYFSGSGSVTAIGTVGAIVGQNFNGTIRNCYANVPVTATGIVNVSSVFAGGIAGENYNGGIVQNCYSTGRVTGSSIGYASVRIGGVVGNSSSIVTNCYATGAVATGTANVSPSVYIGGIVGTGVSVSNCVALNETVTSNIYTTNIGRIVGYNTNSGLSNNYAWSGMKLYTNTNIEVSLTPNIAGQDGANLSAASAKNADFWNNTGIDEGKVGWDFPNIWKWTTDKMPHLNDNELWNWPSYLVDPVPLSISGTVVLSPVDNTATVTIDTSTVTDANITCETSGVTLSGTTLTYDGITAFSNTSATLSFKATKDGFTDATTTLDITIYDGQAAGREIPVTQANVTAFNTYANTTNGLKRNYVQTGNITLTAGSTNWTAIGTSDTVNFTGSYDGGGFTITNLTINKSSENYQGLFGVIGTNGAVKNISLLGGSVTGLGHVGGIAGRSFGLVENCSNTGDVTAGTTGRVGGVVGSLTTAAEVKYCYATGTIQGNGQNTGGVVGVAGANSIGVNHCYFTGTVNSSSYNVGGIVGYVGAAGNPVVSECYSTGNVTSTYSSDSSAVGVGGIVGQIATSGTVQNCYTTGNIEGINSIGGVVGYSSGSGIAKYCVALNERVTATTNVTTVGRIVGANNNLTNNYAWSGMKLYNNSNTEVTPTPNIAGMDGADLSAANAKTQAAWTSAGFDFTDTWEWDSTGANMPSLKGVGTAQPWPAHLIDTVGFARMMMATPTIMVYTDISGDGTAGIDPDGEVYGKYLLGDMVTVIADPDDDWMFMGWQDADGNMVSTDAEYTFEVRSNITLTAVFTQIDEVVQEDTVIIVDENLLKKTDPIQTQDDNNNDESLDPDSDDDLELSEFDQAIEPSK